MKKSLILRKTRTIIFRNQNFVCPYICLAIKLIAEHDDSEETSSNAESIVSWIQNVLMGNLDVRYGGCWSYEDWLRDNFDYDEHKAKVWQKKKVRQARLAWLDWMIAHWEREESLAAAPPAKS